MEQDHTPVALITGAARRIGAETTRTLHAAGYRVAIHYAGSRDEATALCHALNEARADSATTLQADLRDANAVAPLVEAAAAQWGRLDLLVNNASRFYPTPVGGVDAAQWHDLIDSNLKAPFFLAQAATPWLRAVNGCIVNIVDIHAERPLREHPVYCASKAGLAMLTRSLACELGPQVRVNGVSPGAILWPENEIDEATRQRIVERTFLKRKGEASDIAGAVLWLARDAGYVTGQIIAVDGGRSQNG